jgi:hypothetical protein
VSLCYTYLVSKKCGLDSSSPYRITGGLDESSPYRLKGSLDESSPALKRCV